MSAPNSICRGTLFVGVRSVRENGGRNLRLARLMTNCHKHYSSHMINRLQWAICEFCEFVHMFGTAQFKIIKIYICKL